MELEWRAEKTLSQLGGTSWHLREAARSKKNVLSKIWPCRFCRGGCGGWQLLRKLLSSHLNYQKNFARVSGAVVCAPPCCDVNSNLGHDSSPTGRTRLGAVCHSLFYLAAGGHLALSFLPHSTYTGKDSARLITYNTSSFIRAVCLCLDELSSSARFRKFSLSMSAGHVIPTARECESRALCFAPSFLVVWRTALMNLLVYE